MYELYTIFIFISKNDSYKVKINDSIYTYNNLLEILNKDKKNKFYVLTFSDFYKFCKNKNVKLVRW